MSSSLVPVFSSACMVPSRSTLFLLEISSTYSLSAISSRAGNWGYRLGYQGGGVTEMGVGKFLELLYFHLVSKLQLLLGFNVLLVAVLGVLGAGRLGTGRAGCWSRSTATGGERGTVMGVWDIANIELNNLICSWILIPGFSGCLYTILQVVPNHCLFVIIATQVFQTRQMYGTTLIKLRALY